jgi:gamma-tubulin complex component 3
MPIKDRERVNLGINRLISETIPTDPHEDEDEAQQRHDDCFELATAILDG